jgi:hypothetical protein
VSESDFRCRIAIEVSLVDQFAESYRLLKKPKQFCNPVAVNGRAILDPEKHLTCYEVKPLDPDLELAGARGGPLGQV